MWPVPTRSIICAVKFSENFQNKINFLNDIFASNITYPIYQYIQLSSDVARDSQTLSWIRNNGTIPENSVFTGNMAIMTMIYVGTNHSITNHPQFETSLSQGSTSYTQLMIIKSLNLKHLKYSRAIACRAHLFSKTPKWAL